MAPRRPTTSHPEWGRYPGRPSRFREEGQGRQVDKQGTLQSVLNTVLWTTTGTHIRIRSHHHHRRESVVSGGVRRPANHGRPPVFCTSLHRCTVRPWLCVFAARPPLRSGALSPAATDYIIKHHAALPQSFPLPPGALAVNKPPPSRPTSACRRRLFHSITSSRP